MVIRIRCDAKVAQCQLGMKFGCDPVKEAPKLLSLARSLGIQVVGVSFHVGSGCGEPGVFRRAIAAARDLFEYASELGYVFNLLDIGGGYPGGHGTTIDPVSFKLRLYYTSFDYFMLFCLNKIREKFILNSE